MDRRAFLKTILAAGGVTLLCSPDTYALKLFPNSGKQKCAVLFGSRYGSTRDASIWIAEGMGAIADVFDARENPDLSSFDVLVVGSGIYSGKIDAPLEAYLAKNAPSISGKVKALFIVCGGGDTPRAQAYIDALAKSCGARASPGKGLLRKADQEASQPARLQDRRGGRKTFQTALRRLRPSSEKGLLEIR